MVYSQRFSWPNDIVSPGYDGFGTYEEHREPRHGAFSAVAGPLDEMLTPWIDPILYMGLQTSSDELVEVLREDGPGP